MGSAYTPGLQIAKSTRIEKYRELPLPGKALVKVGTEVQATTAVLAADIPGEIDIVRIAERLGFDPRDVVSGMKVNTGEHVEKGSLLCEVKSFFGFISNRVLSPSAGVIEYFTEANAHLGIRHPPKPLLVNAYIRGVVTAVEETKSVTIECMGALIQGIFGVGGENHGIIFPLPVAPDAVVSERDLKPLQNQLPGAVLIGGACFSQGALDMAASFGVHGVVTGSVDSQTLMHLVGKDISISVTGDEVVPFTFIITEGFGTIPIAKRIVDLALELKGREAAVNGATQVRAGALRPEVIVPLETPLSKSDTSEQAPQVLAIGSKIRAIRVPYFGELGTVTALPLEPILIPSGAKVRVLKARLDRGEEVIIPRANVELVQSS